MSADAAAVRDQPCLVARHARMSAHWCCALWKTKRAGQSDGVCGQLAHFQKGEWFRLGCNKAQGSVSMKGMTFICNHG